MDKESSIRNLLRTSLTYKPDSVQTFLIGSLSKERQAPFHPHLSDIDLLLVSKNDSISDYIHNVTQAIEVSATLNKTDVADVFLISSTIVRPYLKTLSVIWGLECIDPDNLIQGQVEKLDYPFDVVPSNHTIKRLYVAKAREFCSIFGRELPLADASQSRKQAKAILKCLKILICAYTEPMALEKTEQQVATIIRFSDLLPIFRDSLGQDFYTNDYLDDLLVGNSVDDWSAWIGMQDELSRRFIDFLPELNQMEQNPRFTEGTCRIWDMLTLDLKNIICEADQTRRKELIVQFADSSAATIAKLALAGVKSLTNFEAVKTPDIVRESFDILSRHLASRNASMESLAGSLVLLEYAFLECIDFSNSTSSQ